MSNIDQWEQNSIHGNALPKFYIVLHIEAPFEPLSGKVHMAKKFLLIEAGKQLPIVPHVNLPDHTIDDMFFQGIEKVHNCTSYTENHSGS